MSNEPEWGTYTLLLECTAETTLEVGALGDYTFSDGGYAYTGSACGSGGFSRIDRHHRTASGENNTLHWHIDYLLHADSVQIIDVITAPGYDIECRVASRVEAEMISKFGASDCSCDGHLHYFDDPQKLAHKVWEAHVDSMSSTT